MTVAVGIAFIVAVSQVYYGGLAENPDYPFELARIKKHILVPFILLLCYIGAVIGGVVLSVLYPIAQRKPDYKDNGKTLKKLKVRIPASGGEDFTAASNSVSKYEKIRMCVWGVALAVFLAAGISIFVYSFNAANYHADALKKDILGLVKNVLSWTAAGLVVGIAAVIADEILIKREIAQAKTAIVNGDRDSLRTQKEITEKAVIAACVSAGVVVLVALLAYGLAPVIIKSALNATQTVIYVLVFVFAAIAVACFAVYQTVKSFISEKVNGILILASRIGVGIIAVTFIIIGAINGGANDVLIKAINICTECIGLG